MKSSLFEQNRRLLIIKFKIFETGRGKSAWNFFRFDNKDDEKWRVKDEKRDYEHLKKFFIMIVYPR